MLAIWEYFWDWGGAAAPVVTPDPVTPGRGSGKGEEYRTLPDEYWANRAVRLATKQPSTEELEDKRQRLYEDVQQLIVEQQQLAEMQQIKMQLQQQLKQAANIDEIKQFAIQLKELEEALLQLTKVYNSRVARAKSLRFQVLNS
jgi:DNA repair exonuclease SbcCD ATPase subunit